jgi:hypothetical protein
MVNLLLLLLFFVGWRGDVLGASVALVVSRAFRVDPLAMMVGGNVSAYSI